MNLSSKKRKKSEDEGKITNFFSRNPTKTKKIKNKSELEMLIDRATKTTPQRPSTPPCSLNDMKVTEVAVKDDDDAKTKKKESNKSPIRKPRSAFGFFFKSQKTALQKIQPSLKHDDLKKEARNLWSVMDAKARAPFEGMARSDRERYKKENTAELSSPSKWQEKKTEKSKKRNISKTRTKARSPFMFYDSERRGELRKLNPDKKYTELIQIARLEWDGMSAEKRAPYIAMSNKEKEEIRKANPPSQSSKKIKKAKSVKSPIKRTIRAPNKPKTAFTFFSISVMREIKDKIQSKEEQAKYIEQRWSSLSLEDRAVYEKKATEDQERFEKAMKDYEARQKVEKKRTDAELKKQCDKIAHVPHPKPARDAVGHFTSHLRKIIRDGLKDGQKFPVKSQFETMIKTRWSAMDLNERMTFVETAKKDKERYEKAMELYEVKSKNKRNEVLQAKRYVLNLRKIVESTKLRKPKEKRSAFQHFCKKVRKKEEDGKKAWDALSSKERKEFTKLASKDSKRYSTVRLDI